MGIFYLLQKNKKFFNLTSDVKNLIVYAMSNGYAVTLLYYSDPPLPPKGKSYRLVEPWGIGIRKTTGSEQLRIYQVWGDSQRGEKSGYWKTIKLSEIRRVTVLDGKGGVGLTYIQRRSDFVIKDYHINFQFYHKWSDRHALDRLRRQKEEEQRKKQEMEKKKEQRELENSKETPILNNTPKQSNSDDSSTEHTEGS